jgi:4-aminobutyrate--pyruvate transaminase
MWGSETYSLKPDILTCAKALSAAYLPISAVLVSSQIVAGLEKQASELGIFGHGYTYSAHPVPAAVALRTLELMEDRQIVEHVRSIAPLFNERVSALKKFNCVGDTRGVGLIGAMEFVGVPGTRAKMDPKKKFSVKAQKIIQDAGVILRSLPGDAIGFCPPLIITKNQINEMFDRIETVMPSLDIMAENFGKEI